MVRLEVIRLELVGEFREVRLRALLEDPAAFGSTYARESALAEEEWVRRSQGWNCDRAMGFLAMKEGVGCGMVCCRIVEPGVEAAEVMAMWVAPEVRRDGVGVMLVRAVEDWARGRGVGELRLMVTSPNSAAIAFYERLGFVRTGMREPWPNDAAVSQFEMAMRLG